MTITQMHIEFLILIDKSNSLAYPDFQPEEIDLFLNKAQETIVKQRFTGNNLKKDSVEETQKRDDDLRNLTRSFSVIVPPGSTPDNKPNGRFVGLPTNPKYWFTLQDEVSVVTDCGTQRIPLKTITHDRYNKIINDPFNKPGDDFAIKLFVDTDKIEIITGGSNATTTNNITYYLRYISKPTEMSLSNNISCELAEHIHREILDLAVNMALEDIESERFKTQIIETQRNE